MARKVLILDTSIMCCWLEIPGKETAGSEGDVWDHNRVNELLGAESEAGSTFVLPLATLIETGNHIAQAGQRRYELAVALMSCLAKSLEEESPWVAFTDQAELWTKERMASLAQQWPDAAVARHSIGDATIKGVADFYSTAGFDVEIVTADAALKAYEPRRPILHPRRWQTRGV